MLTLAIEAPGKTMHKRQGSVHMRIMIGSYHGRTSRSSRLLWGTSLQVRPIIWREVIDEE